MLQRASRLRRPRYLMPLFIAEALAAGGLQTAYRARPPYQRNDYISWIANAKRPETQQRRLPRMLDELEAGDTYMGMPWRGRYPATSPADSSSR